MERPDNPFAAVEVGDDVLYQTDERGGLRYTLPAKVVTTPLSHPGEWSVDPRAKDPVPVPEPNTVHLVVFTPGRGVYVEHSVPYSTADAPDGRPIARSWRHRSDGIDAEHELAVTRHEVGGGRNVEPGR